MGLDGLKRVDYRWGFRDERALQRLPAARPLAPARRPGAARRPDLRPEDAAALPAGVDGVRRRLARRRAQLFDKFLAIAPARSTPTAPSRSRPIRPQVNQLLGVEAPQGPARASSGRSGRSTPRPSHPAGGLPFNVVATAELADPPEVRPGAGQGPGSGQRPARRPRGPGTRPGRAGPPAPVPQARRHAAGLRAGPAPGLGPARPDGRSSSRRS